MASLADVLAAERQRVTAGEATACGFQCGCHGPLVCQRATHPDAPDNRTPHLTDTGGMLVQWMGGCCDRSAVA